MKTSRIILPLLAAVILIGFLAFNGSTVMADTDTVTGVVYSVDNGEATITGFTMPDGFGGDLIIPSTLGGATVTSIGKEAFQYCGAWGGSINSITIPGGVTSIGEAAFMECRAKSINIPDSVTSIAEAAFRYCHAESITIPKGVTSIGDYTFQGCLAQSIIIPGSVTSIGSCAFNGCPFTSITIPEGVTSIGGSAFYYCSITSITIPGSMKNLGLYAFKNCENLASVTILPGITELGQLVFDECNNLTRVDIPVSVTKIYYNTFKNCPNVTIYGSVGSYAEQYAKNNGINFTSNGTYQIVLDKNGGDTEAIPNVVGAAGEFGSLSINPPTRQGWNFDGWNTEPGGTGTTITNATVINEPLTIYAQWTMDTPAGFNDNDFQKLLTFAQQGENATKLGWDLTKPGTWAGVTWNDAAEKRVTAIDCHGSSAPANYLTGSLFIPGCTALEQLNCSFNNLGSLDVAGCTSLTYLSCHYNLKLGSLNISDCTALEYLNCSESNLSSLDISSCGALEELNCSYSSLETLDGSGLTALTELSCYSNYLTSLNVTNCSALGYLGCSGNKLSSLNVSSCTLLAELDCSNNTLTSLNVSGYSALVYLWCGNNEIESLDVSGCTALEELECYENALTSLNVSGCSALTYLDCEDNTNLELIWGLNLLEDNIINDIIEFYSDQSLADLLAKERAVLAVVSQIAALPAVSELTLDDEEAVSAAEAAYNGLSAVQKTFVSNYNKLIAAKNKIIELKAPLTYTLTITASTDGTITTGSSGNYAAGTIIDITVKPASGYSFNKWTSTGGGTFANANNASTTYTMPANPATITATFTYNSSRGGSSGSNSGSSTTPSGTRVSPSGRTTSQTGVNLTFPAGAVESDIQVQVKEVALSAGMTLPDNSQLLSRVMDIVKDKSGNFLKPVTITLSFDNSRIDPNEYDIIIYYYDEDTGKWIALDNIRLNINSGTISGDTNHFTKFAVIATPKTIKEEKPAKPVTPQPIVNIPTDISGHWAKDSIMKMINAGVISGYPDGTFKPDKAVTRAEFTVMIVKALNLETRTGKTFTDTTSHWAKDSIATAAAHGIISGYDENTFGPDDLITREQAAVIIARAAKLEAATGELTFSDSKAISPWAKPSVAAAFKGGFISGYPDSSFKPQGNTTRAEAAVIIGKLI
jgi:uncharacterized repeat protein (TIGR02543 family)